MKYLLTKEFLLVFAIIILGILVRSIYFAENLNFSSDQASFTTESFEIWENQEIRLIGPSISFKTLGREVFQGSLTYYFQLLFLVPAAFEPVIASYLFMLFSMGMMIPLFYGTKKILGDHTAFILTSTYAFAPLYVDYTRFLWNPNFQLSLLPILIYFMGNFHESKNTKYLFLIFFWSGVLLLFHYQFVLIILGLTVYYAFFAKVGVRNLLISLFCAIIGFSPLVIFELRNQFYNTQTIILYLSNLNTVFGSGVGSSINLYYFLSIIIVGFLPFLGIIRKHVHKNLVYVYMFLIFILSFSMNVQRPEHGFGMAPDWNVLYEKQVSEIISSEDRSNFNIINLGYDTVAVVQKYFILIRGGTGLSSDYYANEFLYVITKDIDYMNDPAYEINTFKPSIIVNQWKINQTYKLLLLQRITAE